MRALRRLARLIVRIGYLGPPAIVDGNRLEINRRVRILLYGNGSEN